MEGSRSPCISVAVGGDTYAPVIAAASDSEGGKQIPVAVESGYIGIIIALAGQIVGAVSVNVNALLKTSGNPHIAIAFGSDGYAPVITAAADSEGFEQISVAVEFDDVAVPIALTRQLVGAVSVHVNGALEKARGPHVTLTVGDNAYAAVITAASDIEGGKQISVAVEFDDVAVPLALARQLIGAVSVHVNAALKIAYRPRITVTVGGYAVALIIAAAADSESGKQIPVAVKLCDIAVSATFTRQIIAAVSVNVNAAMEKARSPHVTLTVGGYAKALTLPVSPIYRAKSGSKS